MILFQPLLSIHCEVEVWDIRSARLQVQHSRLHVYLLAHAPAMSTSAHAPASCLPLGTCSGFMSTSWHMHRLCQHAPRGKQWPFCQHAATQDLDSGEYSALVPVHLPRSLPLPNKSATCHAGERQGREGKYVRLCVPAANPTGPI